MNSEKTQRTIKLEKKGEGAECKDEDEEQHFADDMIDRDTKTLILAVA